jgi:hypothetical protein
MKTINLKSKPPETFFAPKWSWFLGESYIPALTDQMYHDIGQVILNKEKEIVSQFQGTNDGYAGLGENSLTARFENFNVFSWNHILIDYLKQEIFTGYLNFLKSVGAPRRKVWIQCWANVMRDGQSIAPHLHGVHPYTYLGGNLIIACNNTSTIFVNPINQINEPVGYESVNEPGKLTLFQNCIPHYTTEHTGIKERITIAFDLIVEEGVKQYSPERQQNLIIFDNMENV